MDKILLFVVISCSSVQSVTNSTVFYNIFNCGRTEYWKKKRHERDECRVESLEMGGFFNSSYKETVGVKKSIGRKKYFAF